MSTHQALVLVAMGTRQALWLVAMGTRQALWLVAMGTHQALWLVAMGTHQAMWLVAMGTHQAVYVLDVEVSLQRGDPGGRDVRDLPAARTLDLVAELAHVLAQAVLTEGVVARQELGLVVVVVEQRPADQAHQHVLVVVLPAAHRHPLQHL